MVAQALALDASRPIEILAGAIHDNNFDFGIDSIARQVQHGPISLHV
jgi:hypothetical protein